jgi:hypothetical protein
LTAWRSCSRSRLAPRRRGAHARARGGIRSLIAPWLALTALTLAVEFIFLFIATYGLLFSLGEGAATVGVVVSVIVLAATPVVWALVLRRRARNAAARNAAARNAAAPDGAPAHI